MAASHLNLSAAHARPESTDLLRVCVCCSGSLEKSHHHICQIKSDLFARSGLIVLKIVERSVKSILCEVGVASGEDEVEEARHLGGAN